MPRNPNVSYFKRGTESKFPQNEFPLIDLLNTIKTGRYRIKEKINEIHKNIDSNGNKLPKYSFLKKQLPCFTISGVFIERKKGLPISSYSYFTILDIDNLSKQGTNIANIQAHISKIPEVFAGFTSPSKDGYKIIVKIDSESKHHEWATLKVMHFFQKKLNIEVDPSGKDITRLCFLSYDPNLYLNKNSKIFKVSLELTMDKKIKKSIDFTEKSISFKDGNRNNFIFRLGCNLNRFGIQESSAIKFAVSKYESSQFTENEVEKSIKSAYRNKSEHGKFKNYDSKPNQIKITELEKNKIKELENEMKLKEIGNSIEDISLLLFSILEDAELESLLNLASEKHELVLNMIEKSKYGVIICEILKDNTTEKDYFLNHKDLSIRQLSKEFTLKKFDSSQFHECAIRIQILRFKANLTKKNYHSTAFSAINKSKVSINVLDSNLEELATFNNLLIDQIKSLFALFGESRQ